ncbi:hypothetical protein FDX19_02625 [Citrobacter sp. wls619]|uniref:DUF5681 domain-containing protein n=1 Tax=Citrobacter sp. wls619 TaxID=2576432 RepID=UPI0010C96CE1|nr:DUF5681 domain-containing protein [Citrobacter sp. wls619]TKV13250.1 hypothetical protein FDX19_02625 [Citrobacter sp. wls619]
MSDRNKKGQFAPGHEGNPNGRRPKATPEERLLEAVAKYAPATIERALTVAQGDNAVLAAVMGYLTETLRTRNFELQLQLLAAAQKPADNGVH